jgi:diguanylate cyclase (GGDEF)-like protein
MRAFLFAATGLVAGLVAYLAVPDGIPGDVLYTLVGVAALGASAVGVLRRIRTRRWPWALIVAGAACWVVADLLYTIQSHRTGESVIFGPIDALYLAGYPLMSLGLMLVGNRLWHRNSAIVWVDSTIITVAGALLVWVVVIEPALRTAGMGTMDEVLAVSYPLADCLLLASVVRFSTAAPWKSMSRHLLLASVLTMLVVDCAFLVYANQNREFPAAVNSLYDLSYVLLALGLLHPRINDLAAPPAPLDVLNGARLWFLGASTLIAPAILLIELAFGLQVSALAVGLSSIVLCTMAMVRMFGMLRIVNEQSAELSEVARRDHLTQLPNRRTADAFLGRALAAGSSFSVAMMDLDSFKAYNDSRGHNAGDHLLVEAAVAWTAHLPPGALLARYGGEEFLLLMIDASVEELTALTGRMRAATPDDQSFSAGVATWTAEEDAKAVLHRADSALYRAKAAGRARTLPDPPAAAVTETELASAQPGR